MNFIKILLVVVILGLLEFTSEAKGSGFKFKFKPKNKSKPNPPDKDKNATPVSPTVPRKHDKNMFKLPKTFGVVCSKIKKLLFN